MKYIIYTDGASSGNPGPGGYAAIIIFDNNHEIPNSKSQIPNVKEIGGKEEKTTNNRMEMRAAIEALRFVPLAQGKQEVEIHTDSEYLMKGATIWIKNWQKNNWKTKNKKQVLNKDLWQDLWEEMQKRKVTWQKVLGHSGHEFNERCDEIATSFSLGKTLTLYDGSKQGYKSFH